MDGIADGDGDGEVLHLRMVCEAHRWALTWR
jgi:hypothetical protein